MCVLCVEIQKKNMNIKEVARAFREFDVPEGHTGDIIVAIEENYGVEKLAKELNVLFEEELTKTPQSRD